MNKTYASAAALCFIYNVQAVKVTESREPLLTWSPTAKKGGFKKDYTVPNFGPQSTEIKDTYESLASTENLLGHKLGNPAAPKPKDPPRDYFVPNFGKDEDIATTQVNAIAAEGSLGHTWDWHKDTSKPPPRDYFVPNFGEDREITFTRQHLAQTEDKLGHKWNWSKAGKSHDKDYFVPNFGIDSDIKDSLNHLNQQQSLHGNWDLPKDDWFLQTAEKTEREPLLTWSPKAHKLGFKADYFVPNFGAVDSDLVDQGNHVSLAEAKLGHVWTPHRDEDDEKWVVPKIDGEFQNPEIAKYIQTDAEINREPLLTWSPTAKKGGFKKDYFVPNFGPQDTDIADTYGDLALAEQKLGHHWNWSKAGKSHDKDYFVPNFGRDADINDSIKHLNDAQGTLGHWDYPKDDWF